MIIGGCDCFIKRSLPDCVKTIKAFWNGIVIEDSLTGLVVEELQDRREVFVYPNEQAKKAWDEGLLGKHLENKMIHLIYDGTNSTFAVADTEDYLDQIFGDDVSRIVQD